MKLFKKLMAVTLAGIMALSLLTGCASIINQNELVAYLNDNCGKIEALDDNGVTSIEQGDSALARKVLNAASEYTATHRNDYYTDVAQTYDYLYDRDNIRDLLDVNDTTKDIYYYGYTRVTKFQSKEMQSMQTEVIGQNLFYSIHELNWIDGEGSDKATVSIATKEIGGETWVVAVFVQKGTSTS